MAAEIGAGEPCILCGFPMSNGHVCAPDVIVVGVAPVEEAPLPEQLELFS